VTTPGGRQGNLLAGRKARVLYRLEGGVAVLEVEDPDDDVLVTVYPDGSMHESRLGGLAGLRGAWESGEALPVSAGSAQVSASSGSDGVPAEYAGREQPEPEPEPEKKKRSWFRHGGDRVEPESVSVPELEPEPVSGEVARQAEVLARDVWQTSAVISMAQLAERHQRPVAVIGPLVDHAVAVGWLARAGEKVRKGAVSPFPMSTISDVDGPSWGGPGAVTRLL
jgi:hypothetical protein